MNGPVLLSTWPIIFGSFLSSFNLFLFNPDSAFLIMSGHI